MHLNELNWFLQIMTHTLRNKSLINKKKTHKVALNVLIMSHWLIFLGILEQIFMHFGKKRLFAIQIQHDFIYVIYHKECLYDNLLEMHY